ncbi:flagellar hook-basal body protein FliE [Rhizobium deserti]|uniref:Flagellar hook-basal body complex protein FliE n=1 Tax=Rhizobium deserti TaxID=2547961 RepID=A0A4R5UGP8_9HYPH|nr:flagellar hook-basal body complex protein FliE [Rhizobium deserti]TDK35110.1 flagellar hook-basal body protein FliE [Rhizobium deserti]
MINPIEGLGLFAPQTDKVSDDNTVSKAVGTAVGAAATAVAGPGFSEILGTMAADAVNSVKGGETASFAGIQGKANTREVVDAVLQAEQALKTATAFRDKIVSAYLDITKMQI